MFKREYAEWINFWWEEADHPEKKRIALIGDSITNSYRDAVQVLLRGKDIMADKFTGSRCAGDPALLAELEYALGPANGYKYEVIHFNNGLHGECNNSHISFDIYKKGIQDCIALIRRLQPSAKLVLVTSTHMSSRGADASVIDMEKNAVIMERNAVVRTLAAEEHIVLDDLWNEVAGKSEYPHSDGVHFGAEGVNHLAKTVADKILSLMEP
jgi:lysophospholipase L1-like esterase